MRYISAQFLSYFDNDLWIENAHRANQMTLLLEEVIKSFPELKITQSAQVNALFVQLPRKIIRPLQEKYPFYVWDELTSEVRWMCSFDTTEDDIKAFCSTIKQLLSSF